MRPMNCARLRMANPTLYCNQAAGKHRGFAFVMMETSEQAQEVIEKLNGTTVWGRVLMVWHLITASGEATKVPSVSRCTAPQIEGREAPGFLTILSGDCVAGELWPEEN